METNFIVEMSEYINLVLKLAIAVFIIWNLKGIISAFKGQNGNWQVDEVAKFVMVVLLVFMTIKEANRTHEWRIFTDWMFAIFVFGLFFMAKMEHVIDKMTNWFGHGKKDKPVVISGASSISLHADETSTEGEQGDK